MENNLISVDVFKLYSYEKYKKKNMYTLVRFSMNYVHTQNMYLLKSIVFAKYVRKHNTAI